MIGLIHVVQSVAVTYPHEARRLPLPRMICGLTLLLQSTTVVAPLSVPLVLYSFIRTQGRDATGI